MLRPSIQAVVARLLWTSLHYEEPLLAEAARNLWAEHGPDSEPMDLRIVQDGTFWHLEVLVPDTAEGRRFGAHFGAGYMSSPTTAERWAKSFRSLAKTVGIQTTLQPYIHKLGIA